MQYNQGSSQREVHDADETDQRVEDFFKKYANKTDGEPTLGDNQQMFEQLYENQFQMNLN